MKKFRYLIEGFFLKLMMLIFAFLSPKNASNLGGWIGKTIGPKLAASRKAINNIKLSLPKLDDNEVNLAIKGMWENLGRIMAEYPHLEYLAKNNTTIIGAEILKKHKNCIIVGMHIGNWEIPPVTLFAKLKYTADMVYRPPNNPVADRLLMKARTLNGQIPSHAKSKQGTRTLVKSLINGNSIGILIDQKYNEGIEVDFFNRPAMTSPAAIQLAQKYNTPLIIGKNARINNNDFVIEFIEYKGIYNSDGSAKEYKIILNEIHKEFENWIAKYPEQWLWLHRRWK